MSAEKLMKKRDRIKRKGFKKFQELFSFEEGVDITDDTNVLYRRNIVIKNIIFLSNMAYTVILFVISFGDPGASNWVLTLLFMPFTFFLNRTLKKLIYEDPKNNLKQQISMYLASFYIFLSGIFIYFKLKSGSEAYLSEAGYILIYYSIVVVSLYQNKMLMRLIYKWLFLIVTLIHFTLTYQIYRAAYATSIIEFIKQFPISPEFRDIALRSLILVLFMVVVYSSVQISEYMHAQRKTELIKRQEVEGDFRTVIGDLFDSVLDSNVSHNDDEHEKQLIGLMSKKLAGLLSMPIAEQNSIYEYAIIKVDKNELSISKEFNKVALSEFDYAELKRKALVGREVVKRIQLSQKCEDLVRAHMEGSVNPHFVERMKQIQADRAGQIILLSDVYITLRSAKSYKRPQSHRMSMDLLESQFKQYFDDDLYERFTKWNKDFEDMYNEW